MDTQEQKNLHFIETIKFSDIISRLNLLSVKAAHFTNGTFAYAPELIIPTVLAGFKRVIETQGHLALVIAVNSDKSMQDLGKKEFDSQKIRASKVAEPLAKLFPQNQVVVIYYDDKTPNNLYEALKKQNFTRTLHKWGYGTSLEAPKIEGAECFEMVYAFPVPNDIKPVCYYDTEVSKEPQNILVDDLRGKLINEKGVLFDLPQGLEKYSGKLQPVICSSNYSIS